jgi:hypothetical protein
LVGSCYVVANASGEFSIPVVMEERRLNDGVKSFKNLLQKILPNHVII